MTTMISFASF